MPQENISSERVEGRLARAGLRPRWRGDPPAELAGLRADSRAVKPGDLFCALPGTLVDGHAFVGWAARAGAAAAVVERACDERLPQLVVTDTHAALAHLALLFEGDPTEALTLIGITGTNGKSTTAWLTRWVLSGRMRAAALGTLGTVSLEGEVGRPTLTTPDPISLARTLAEFREAGAQAVAMEVSSHALDQRRADGLTFDAVAFTSFSREHLEYHPDLQSYRAAKLHLLDLLRPGGVCAVNADEPAWKGVAPDGSHTLRYGLEPTAEVRAADISFSADGSSFRLVSPDGDVAVDLPLPAEFNVRNALAAASIALGLGIDLDHIAARLSMAPAVPGRMEVLARDPILVFRDFAHNPDSCERVLSTLKGLVPGHVIAVFGCGGDRDRGKRPIMGEIVTRLADAAIVTSDNPRSEDPAEICRDVVAELDPSDYTVIVDRREAIAHALALAGPGDAVVLLGKGHETYQIIGDRTLPFDEAVIVGELVAALPGAGSA